MPRSTRFRTSLTAALAATLAVAPFAPAADDPLPPVDPPARAAVAEDPHVACALTAKSLDPAKQTLTYAVTLRNKTAKPIAKLTVQSTWRDAAGNDLVYVLQNHLFDKPLAPGEGRAIERKEDAPPNATPKQRAEWLKKVEGLKEVRMAVLRIFYADGTVETIRFPKGE